MQPLHMRLAMLLITEPTLDDMALATRLGVPSTIVRTIRATDLFQAMLHHARNNPAKSTD